MDSGQNVFETEIRSPNSHRTVLGLRLYVLLINVSVNIEPGPNLTGDIGSGLLKSIKINNGNYEVKWSLY